MSDIFQLVDEYKAALDEKDRLKQATTDNNKLIEEKRQALAQAMIEAESPRISRGGFSYTLSEKTEYSKRACDEEEFFSFLEGEGLGGLIKRTVNATTLNSAMRQQVGDLKEEAEEEAAEDGEDLPSDWLPEEYRPFISAYSHYDVAKRKESNKTASKAKKEAER